MLVFSLLKFLSALLFAEKFVKQPMEDIVEFLQEKMSDYPYNIDQMMDLLQESRFELRKGGLESPPAPSPQEFPVLPPGSSLKRGTFETASARARKNKQKDKIIELPPGKSLSPAPPSPDDYREVSEGKVQVSERHHGRSYSGRRSDSSVNRSNSFGDQLENSEKRYGNSEIRRNAPEGHSVSTPEPHYMTHPGMRTASHAEPHPVTHHVSHSGEHLGSHNKPHYESHHEEARMSHPESPDGPHRVTASLSNAEIAKFNQNLKNSYLRSQQFLRTTSGRRQNGSRPGPLEGISDSSSRRYVESDRPEHVEHSNLAMSLPGSVNVEQSYIPPTTRSRGTSIASSPNYSSPVSPVHNGAVPLERSHAPVWQQEQGPEGSVQFTLTQASSRQMTFV